MIHQNTICIHIFIWTFPENLGGQFIDKHRERHCKELAYHYFNNSEDYKKKIHICTLIWHIGSVPPIELHP